ncbi:hypothetical protein CCAND93_760009 [Capnocytophaga canis]|uniref:Uncharacterized protein n=1 Tax=Capnocytophaga canis TaxID=1848903 RepID=A0A0B7IVX8_9FLAO|nr:hypothetical protein CCAND93_760009 [Capnocytophaga canis]
MFLKNVETSREIHLHKKDLQLNYTINPTLSTQRHNQRRNNLPL